MSAEAVITFPATMTEALESLGIEVEDSNGSSELVIKREMADSGRGRVLINGSVITVRDLNALMDRLVDIHGQSEAKDRIAGQLARELSISTPERRRSWRPPGTPTRSGEPARPIWKRSARPNMIGFFGSISSAIRLKRSLPPAFPPVKTKVFGKNGRFWRTPAR